MNKNKSATTESSVTTNYSTTTKRSGSKAFHGAGWLINLSCFVAVICIGTSLILSKFGLNGQISTALSTIAQAISYSVLVVISFFYIIRRRSIPLWVIWGISVVLIVISFIL